MEETLLSSQSSNQQDWWNAPLIVAAVAIMPAIINLIFKAGNFIFKKLKRFWYRHFPGELNIAISIKSSGGLSRVYCCEVKKRMLEITSKIGLDSSIRLKDLSDSVDFSNEKEVKKFGINQGIDLIVWGEVSQDGLRVDGNLANDFLLHFVFIHPENNKKQVGKTMLANIESSLAQKNYWTIIEGNSLNDVNIVSQNLATVSLFILGLTMKVQGRIYKAIEIFECLYKQLTGTSNRFKKFLTDHLIHCYRITAMDAYLSKNYKKALEISKKILAIDQNDLPSIANVAVSLFKLNDVVGAKIMVKKMNDNYPNYPLAKIDAAFFYILEKNFTKADQLYKKLSKIDVKDLSYNPVEVVEFLEENFKKSKEPALRYAIAMTEYYHLRDFKLAKEDFQEFIKLSRNRLPYKKMVMNTYRILEKIGTSLV